jgi:hypothetical protein
VKQILSRLWESFYSYAEWADNIVDESFENDEPTLVTAIKMAAIVVPILMVAIALLAILIIAVIWWLR